MFGKFYDKRKNLQILAKGSRVLGKKYRSTLQMGYRGNKTQVALSQWRISMELTASSEATLGKHIIAEFSECDQDRLKDMTFIREALFKAANIAGATVLDSSFYRFGNGGVSGVLIIAESHLSIHTWPECGYAACDFYTCGSDTKPEKACRLLAKLFKSDYGEYLTIQRGIYCGEKQYRYEADLKGDRTSLPE